MRIDRVVLREVRLSLRSPFKTSFGTTRLRRVLLVEAAGEGLSGWGECVAPEGPFFNEEDVETAWHALGEHLIWRVAGRSFPSASAAREALEPVRGNRMAKAGLEGALWDLEAKARGVPLQALLGGGVREIPVGISLGIEPSADELLRRIEAALAAGYRRIKVKIQPGWDEGILGAIRRRFGPIPLTADANGAYRPGEEAPLLALDGLGLEYLEQPFPAEHFLASADLQARLSTPVCLDESLTGVEALRVALRLGSLRVANLKVGRVGGVSEGLRFRDRCRAGGTPLWCGGMLESGVGRAANVHLASTPGFTLPGDISETRRYFDDDVAEPPFCLTPRGTLEVPEGPGIGVAVRRASVEERTGRAASFP